MQDDAEKARRGGWIFSNGNDPITGEPDMLGVYEKAKPGYIGTDTRQTHISFWVPVSEH